MAEFIFFRPQAKKVCILGDFNGWRDNELTMTRQEDGTWVARVFLPPGDFRFRYRCDGEWFIDYAAFGIECGDFGLDSVVRICPEKIKEQPVRGLRPAQPKKAAKARRTRWACKSGQTNSRKNAVA
jgi:1,4-alpha-glucan branching enzyme